MLERTLGADAHAAGLMIRAWGTPTEAMSSCCSGAEWMAQRSAGRTGFSNDAPGKRATSVQAHDGGSITLITGAMAAGKSTVAQALAERFQRGVHVRGDIFRRMVVSGREEMTDPPSAEAIRQLQLRYELGVQTSLRYAEAGFDVVYQDIILGPDLAIVVSRLGGALNGVVVLCPPPKVLVRRDVERHKTGTRVGILGIWISNSATLRRGSDCGWTTRD